MNNYRDSEIFQLKQLHPSKASFLILGKEVGAQGTPHLQGYLEVTKKVSLSTLKSWPGLERAHIEKANGSADQNLAYCSKEDPDPVLLGSPFRQGARTDLEEMKSLVDQGVSELDLWEQDFRTMVRYHRAISHYRSLRALPRHWATEVIVLIGPSGCGKTRFAYDLAKSRHLNLWSYSGGGWFDGYQGHEVALFDDFYGSESGIAWDVLLKLLDRYPYQVPIKGAFREWCPRIVIITSNADVNEWYPRVINQDALWRRIFENGYFIDRCFWE